MSCIWAALVRKLSAGEQGFAVVSDNLLLKQICKVFILSAKYCESPLPHFNRVACFAYALFFLYYSHQLMGNPIGYFIGAEAFLQPNLHSLYVVWELGNFTSCNVMVYHWTYKQPSHHHQNTGKSRKLSEKNILI